MPTSPLHNLQQQIWDERGGRRCRYLLVSTVRDERWEVALWANESGSVEGEGEGDVKEGKCVVWSGEGDDSRAAELADAILAGNLHVEERPKGGFKVFIHVPKPSVIVYVGEEEAGMHVPDLVESSLAILSAPKTDSNEIRALTTLLSEKDAKIAEMEAKLMSLRGQIQRQQATNPKRDGPVTQSQKPREPVVLNRLPPTKKRKAPQEEEFAGSDEDEDDDDDDEDDDDDDVE